MSLIVNGTTIPQGKPIHVNGNPVHKVIANGKVVWVMEYLDLISGSFVFSGETPKFDKTHYAKIRKDLVAINAFYGTDMATQGGEVTFVTGNSNQLHYIVAVEANGKSRIYKIGARAGVTDVGWHEYEIGKGQALDAGLIAIDSSWTFGSPEFELNKTEVQIAVGELRTTLFYHGQTVAQKYSSMKIDGNVNPMYIFGDDGYVYKRGTQIHADQSFIGFQVMKGPKWK